MLSIGGWGCEGSPFYPSPPSIFWTLKVGDISPHSIEHPPVGTQNDDSILARSVWVGVG